MKKKFGKLILFSAYAAGAAYLLVSVFNEKAKRAGTAKTDITDISVPRTEKVNREMPTDEPVTDGIDEETEVSEHISEDEDKPEEVFEERGEVEELSEPVRTFVPEVGNFILPEGWVEIERIRSQYKYFYCPKGLEKARRPDNISVSRGKNDFDISEHEAFRNAVLNQLQKQISGRDTEEITAAQGFNDAGDVVYKFTISEKNGTTTVQYYIIGNHEFTLVQETNFSGSYDIDEAAEIIAMTYRKPEIK